MVDLGKIHRIDEARHSRRQELEFIIRNRRNRLIGLWAGQRLGLDDKQAAAYATDIVGEGISSPGDAALVKVLMRDLAKAEVAVPEPQLLAELERFHRVAAMEFGEKAGKERAQPSAA